MDAILKGRRCFFIGHWSTEPGVREAEGLFAGDTRHLNRIDLVVDGHTLTASQTGEDRLRSLTLRMAHAHGPGPVSATATFSLGDVLEVTHQLTNETGNLVEADVVVAAEADFRDLFELRGVVPRSRGHLLEPTWGGGVCRLGYQARDLHRLSTRLRFDPAPRSVESRPGGDPWDTTGIAAHYRVAIPAGASWSVTTTVQPDVVGPVRVPAGECHSPSPSRAAVTTDNPEFDYLLARSLSDLDALVTVFPEGEIPAAGIPWYVAPFGRDSLISCWQTLHLDPHRAAETLRMLARLQGRRSDPVTGEQPGKIIHEARYGELARLGEIPHRPYYGTVDATPLYLMLAAETVAWTGDDLLLEELRPTIDSALSWIDNYGDADGDGLVDYWLEPDPGRVPALTARHQSWKDSDDSLHHPDGREPHGHVAPVEVQGYTYLALTRLADVLMGRGEIESAAQLRTRAAALKERVEESFWIEEEGYYAQALDGDGRQIGAISSNPGHLLSTGLVASDRARALVERMARPDLDSGWGIRTLSSKMAAYDPASYHNGSVWPHDNHLIADGCYRTGHVAMANRIFSAMFEAGAASPDGRLDELYCGDDRETSASTSPVRYLRACRPQAWAAGVYPGLIRSALGLWVDPIEGVLLVSPALPAFLGEVEIDGLTVRGATGSVAVRRRGDGLMVESTGIAVRVVPHRAS
jgi:glycogen debranching enzyme